MIPHMERRRPTPTPEELQRQLDEHFAHLKPTLWTEPPVEGPRPSLSPEELQRGLDEAFAGWTPPPQREPPPSPKLSPQELQRALDDAFSRDASRPAPSPSPRRLRSMLRSLRSRPAKPAPWDRAGMGRARRRRCDARVKNLFRIGKNGVRVSRGLFCKAWAMENGRCRVHGGLSTGPRSPEGRARVVAAMVEGRREWVARRRAEGRRFTAGRKRGERWVTEPMRERARAEAHRLGGGRFTLDRALVLALLRTAKGDRVREAKAKAMLDAQERAALERDRQAVLARIDDLRASRPNCASRY
jgi:hypothetical protein